MNKEDLMDCLKMQYKKLKKEIKELKSENKHLNYQLYMALKELDDFQEMAEKRGLNE